MDAHGPLDLCAAPAFPAASPAVTQQRARLRSSRGLQAGARGAPGR